MTEHSEAGTVFESKRYTNWPAMTEDIQAGNLHAAFILAPLAMVLAREGTKPVKIVHLGHRDGNVHGGRQGPPYRTLRICGETHCEYAIPHRSNQRILIERLKEQAGFADGDVTLIDFPPPEMPAGLKAGQFEAYIVGEPHAARAEIGDFGRILYYTKDVWPTISCVLVVTQELIDTQPELVQELVSGITASGEWIDDGPQDQLVAGIFVEGETPVGGPEPEGGKELEKPCAAHPDHPARIRLPPRMQAAQIGGLYWRPTPEL
ncbi:MAG: ABC transporter substrate-binding protein [Planctomycetota bacterium]